MKALALAIHMECVYQSCYDNSVSRGQAAGDQLWGYFCWLWWLRAAQTRREKCLG